MRIVLVAFNTATAKAYQQALSAAGQSADSEPRGSLLPPLGDAGFAAAH
jgi:hypothetical protein